MIRELWAVYKVLRWHKKAFPKVTYKEQTAKRREELIQCLGSNIDELDVKKSVLIIENNKLRGLLKECKEKIHQEFICSDYLSIDKFFDLLTRINAAIGESEEK